MREPLLAPLAAIAAGIVASRFVPFETRELLAAILALFFLGFLSLRRDLRRAAATCAIFAFLFAGVLLEVVHRPAPAPRIDADSYTPLLVSGCVVEPSVFFENREQFVLELEPGARARVNVYLREGQTPPALRYGQRVEFEARLRRPRNFGNPGAFDYAGYLARKDIYWTASTRTGVTIDILPGRCGSRFQSVLFDIRGAALDRLEQLYKGQPYETGMMQAILIGESSKLDKVWTDEFRSTGTFHALVISGTHVAVLAAFLLFLLRICFVPPMAALAAAASAAWLYALITGWQAPVIRSAAGLTLFLIGRYFYRNRRMMNLLAAVALGFLVADPPQLFDPSFQLSFLSVAFLGAIAVPLIERTSGPVSYALRDLSSPAADSRLTPHVAQFRVEMRLLAETVQLGTRLPLRWAALAVAFPARAVLFVFELFATSAVVQAGLALPMAIYFHRVSFSGLSANVVIVPLMAAVVPVGFTAIVTGLTLPADIARWILAVSRWVVHRHAQWEPEWRIPDPPLWLALAVAAALIVLALLQGKRRRLWRIGASLTLTALLGIVLWHPFRPAIAHGVLELTAIDVGQGDSILVTLPDGKLMLVDGGGIASFGRRTPSRMDIGEDVVSPYLWSRHIRRIDVVALSHAHQDHLGGLAAILRNFDVGELWTGATPAGPVWDPLAAVAHARGVKIVPMRRGDPFVLGGATLHVIAPSADYEPGLTPRNNDSLAIGVKFGERSFLLTGDMERQVEAELIASGMVTHADVLKVAHHGSKTSSTPALLDAASPSFAIISAGFENSYGHPHRDILARLADRRVCVLRTDKLGLVTIRTNGRKLELDTGIWLPQTNIVEPVFDR